MAVLLSCRDTGHARVICACGAIVYECRCGVPSLVKDAWFAAHAKSITRVLKCLTCRPPKGKPIRANRRTHQRRKALTRPDRQFDARQTTRRK